ncbi:hypothetical protein B0T24DRAFT_613655 [Lasiosphaeria ovina]|uniref:Secreted protein n=1 Tax=Lasiosphaeria ovina TaxID=92902 RepID=A0AAE0NEE5_9PEZI|nr:hypothetical protein B0T24DRAFT_613655 [Lasiosphaeria ovina]
MTSQIIRLFLFMLPIWQVSSWNCTQVSYDALESTRDHSTWPFVGRTVSTLILWMTNASTLMALQTAHLHGSTPSSLPTSWGPFTNSKTARLTLSTWTFCIHRGIVLDRATWRHLMVRHIAARSVKGVSML